MSRYLTGQTTPLTMVTTNYTFLPNVTEATMQFAPPSYVPGDLVTWPASSEVLYAPALQVKGLRARREGHGYSCRRGERPRQPQAVATLPSRHIELTCPPHTPRFVPFCGSACHARATRCSWTYTGRTAAA